MREKKFFYCIFIFPNAPFDVGVKFCTASLEKKDRRESSLSVRSPGADVASYGSERRERE
jgi:hypothetical protein